MCEAAGCAIPRGLCHCGCGTPTRPAAHSNARLGYVKGQPYLFAHGHNPPIERLRFDVRDCGFDTPCHVWLGGLSPEGYARIQVDRRKHNAHRWAYEQVYGRLPKGCHVDHLCRNRACVNVEHLEAVTPAENYRRGLCARLSYETVDEIRALLKGGWMQADIARAYGVTYVAVNHIKKGLNWVAPGGVVHVAAA